MNSSSPGRDQSEPVPDVDSAGTPGGRGIEEITPPPITLRTVTVVRWGMLGWLVALVVVLAIPDLRTGDRSWWPWVPVAALGLGAFGLAYLSRGRGNAIGS